MAQVYAGNQYVIPGTQPPPSPQAIVVKFSPNTKHAFMLTWLARGYNLSPQEFVRRMVASAFTSQVSEWGFNYERK